MLAMCSCFAITCEQYDSNAFLHPWRRSQLSARFVQYSMQQTEKHERGREIQCQNQHNLGTVFIAGVSREIIDNGYKGEVLINKCCLSAICITVLIILF